MDINDERALTAWLSDKPGDWAQGVALRAALRALPYIGSASDFWLKNFALLPFGAMLTSWAQLADKSIDVLKTGSRANARFGGESFDFIGYKNERIAAIAADASYHSADAQTRSKHVITDCVRSVGQAAEAFRSFSVRHGNLGENGDACADALWHSVALDCKLLIDLPNETSAETLAVWTLWDRLPDFWDVWEDNWHQLTQRLIAVDPNYKIWIDWYDDRILGSRTAFRILGDISDLEDKKILRRVAEATNDEFWGNGYEYVNATLKEWLEEAVARVARSPIFGHVSGAFEISGSATATAGPKPSIKTPPQEFGATAYGVNADGKLDRLPHFDQQHLRDLPDQRRTYADLRDASLQLLEEGQRLGARLQFKIERAISSLPEHFKDAEAWPVWRDFNALRRLYRAHQMAVANPEPDISKLEPVVAETLGGLLDIYNNFAFADDGLRAKDENRISPQERPNAETEAMAAVPIVEAIRNTPEMSTERARDDIVADFSDDNLPIGDPYHAQVLDQANRARRNWLAGAFNGAKKALASPKLIGKAAALGAIGGAAGFIGKEFTKGIVAYEYQPLLQFIATNAVVLQNYVAVAFSSYPHLHDLIERISTLWKRYNRP